MLGVEAISLDDAVTTANERQAAIGAQLVRRRERVVVAGPEMIATRVMAIVCPTREIDTVSTRSAAHAGEIERIRSLGVTVILV